jgi:hypothetical protein
LGKAEARRFIGKILGRIHFARSISAARSMYSAASFSSSA